MKRTLFLSVFVVLLATGCGLKEPETEIAAIKKARQIVITTTGVNIPFSYLGGTGIQGFDVDLGNAIADKLGVRARWVSHSFNEHFDLVLADKADVAIANITITDERKQRVAFSDPYFKSGQILATRKANKDIKSIEDVAGKRLGVHRATTSEKFARANEYTSKADIQLFDSIDAALLALNGGSIDAIIADFPIVRRSVTMSFPQVQTLGEPLTVELYGVVLKPGEDELLKIVNESIAQLKQSGRYDQMIRNWFGSDPEVLRLIKE